MAGWRQWIILFMLGFFVSSACMRESSSSLLWNPQGQAIPLGPKPSTRTRSSYTAKGLKSMAATAHPLATDAAFQILRDGGNAVDAAVAASFVISVVRPQSTGLGGGGFLLFYDNRAKTTLAFDFRERAPRRATSNMFFDQKGQDLTMNIGGRPLSNLSENGPLSVGVPGLVAGLARVHQQHGKLKWEQVLAPSIKVARQGFPVYGSLAKALAERRSIMTVFPETAQIFYPQGRLLKEGDLLVQKDLADTLTLLAHRGAKEFYEGAVATKIEQTILKYGGILDRQDLKNYRVKNAKPVVGSFRGYQVLSMPPPSSGGAHLIQMLQMMECLGSAGQNGGEVSSENESCHRSKAWSLPRPSSAEAVHLMAEVMKRAFSDRARYMGDPEFFPVPLAQIISREYARKLAKMIDFDQATDAQKLPTGKDVWTESPSTTHLSIVDREGHAVSTTQTINYLFGSSMVAGGTGIILNNEMDDFSKKPGVPNVFGLVGSEANQIAPGKTMLSSMSPTLIFNSKGELVLVLGSPGGPKIITATFQSVLNYIGYGMPLMDAVHYGRIHHQWLPDVLMYEKGLLSDEVLSDLKSRGHQLKESSDPFGDVQAIGWEGGVWVGVSDIRSDGWSRGQ